ncbi:MAG: M48 family metallopeptidase [Reinekea sp.]
MSDPRFYDCHAYHQNLPKGKATGTMETTAMGFVFILGDQQIEVPYEGCQLEIGGAGDRILFIRHPDVYGWTFYSNNQNLLDDEFLSENPELQQQIIRVRKKRNKHFVAIAAALLIVVGIPALLLFRMNWISGLVAHQVPVTWEESLGETVIKQYSLDHELMDEEKAEAQLKPLVQPLLNELSDSRYQYEFFVALDASLNAFALPGGKVVIHTQLILEADDAEELLGVLAHEMTHVEEQHGIRNIIGTAGIYTVVSALFGDVSGILATVAGAAPFLLNQSYSRDFEREADKKGFDLLVRANINPAGMVSFFQKLIDKENEALESIEDERTRSTVQSAMKFLSTHPATAERIEYLNELNRSQNGSYIDLSEEFHALQQVVRHFVAENDVE